MAKLKYLLRWVGSGGFSATPHAGAWSQYLGGASGTPQTRIYPIAGTPPAFAAYPQSIGGAAAPGLADGDYYVDYKDGVATNQRLAKVRLVDYTSSCWGEVGGNYVNPIFEFIRFETYVQVTAGTSSGAGCQASVDGGLTWKTLIFDGFTTAANWTDVELAALGISGNSIPIVKIRRNQLLNRRNILSFSDPFDIDWPPFGFTRAYVSDTSGLAVSTAVTFYNSTLYGSGFIVEINPGSSFVFQHSYVGTQGGVFIADAVPCSAIVAEDVFIGEPSVAPFTLGETHTNETAAEANDGTISLVIAGGSGSFTILWTDGSAATNRTGLSAGVYSVTVTDNVSAQDETLEITITEPAPEPIPAGTYLEVPKMQTLRFVREAAVDNCNTFQDFDNTLFCKMVFFGVKVRTPFYQKVCKCDLFPIQIHSNYPAHEVTIRDLATDVLVKTLGTPTLEQQLTGLSSSFGMYFSDSSEAAGDPAGTSRVFFDSGTIPIVVNVGDTFTVTGNPDGYDGTYAIVGISNDPLLGAPYLLVTLTYDAASPTSSGTAAFTTNVVDFDVYETIFNAQDVAEGRYYVRIRGVNLDLSFTEFVSEPIYLRTLHPETLLIEARNFDNTADVVFTTGFTVRLRLECKLQKPITGRQDENYRESNGSPVKLSSKPQRKYKLEYFSQPFYRLELLSVLWGWDQVLVNKKEYQSDEGTSEPANRDFFLLANGNVTIEQKQWFTQYNGDDLGSVDPGFILTQHGYIQRS